MALSPEEIRRQLASDRMDPGPSRGPSKPPRKPQAGNGRGWGENSERSGQVVSTPQEIHRTLPHAVEAEQGILGSMMIGGRPTIAEVVAHIREEYLYVPAHQTVFTRMVELWDKGVGIDLITFTQVLRDLGQLESVGGPSFITSLFTFVPTAANVGYYLDIVRDKYLLREVIARGTAAVRLAFDEQDEPMSVIDRVEASFIGLGDDRFKSTIVSAKDSVMEAIEAIELCYENRGAVTGVPTGLSELDRATGGLQKSHMIIIAGRPSMGKTALGMNIAEHAAIEAKKSVGVFSLEMSRLELVQRLICSRARINMQKVRDGFLGERDFPVLTAASSRIAESKIYIDDTGSLPILELKARARRMKIQFHVELLIIDYLQLATSGSKRGQENRQLEISEISSGIKALAKELEIPIVVLSQLNRQPEGRPGGKPRLSDLRESGSLEQDADLVALLHRAEVYEQDEDARREVEGEATLIIAKQRSGPIGDIPLTFLKEFTRFEDRAQPVEYHLERRPL